MERRSLFCPNIPKIKCHECLKKNKTNTPKQACCQIKLILHLYGIVHFSADEIRGGLRGHVMGLLI